MKITNVKAAVAKVLTIGFLAGAVVMAMPAKAQAEQFGVEAQFGHPFYPSERRVYIAPDRFDRFHDREAFERRQAFERHEAWERDHRFEHREWDRRFYR